MKKVIALSIVIVAIIGITIYAQNREPFSPEERQLKEWVQLAEKGTRHLSLVVLFYDLTKI